MWVPGQMYPYFSCRAIGHSIIEQNVYAMAKGPAKNMSEGGDSQRHKILEYLVSRRFTKYTVCQ